MRYTLIFAFAIVIFLLFSTLHSQSNNGFNSGSEWNSNSFNTRNRQDSTTNASIGTRNSNPVEANGFGRGLSSNGVNGFGQGSTTPGANGNRQNPTTYANGNGQVSTANGANGTGRIPNTNGANGTGRIPNTNGANGNGQVSTTNGANGNGRGFKEYIKNKNFNENINLPYMTWNYFPSSQIPNWKITGDKFEIGHGKVYNSKWEENITVAEIEVEKNELISQEFVVPSEQNCVFSFRFSAKDNVYSSFLSSGQSTSGLLVKVNGVELLRIEHLTDSDVHSFTKEVKSIRGINKVEVTDIAYSDSHGVVVTDFSFKCSI